MSARITGGTAELRFTVSVKPKKPTLTVSETRRGLAQLAWDVNAGVSGWELQVGSGSWTAIPARDIADTFTDPNTGTVTAANVYTPTSLATGTRLILKVRGVIGKR